MTGVEVLELFMEQHPKARVNLRGPEHGDRRWWLSLTDEEGDVHDFKGFSLAGVLSAFAEEFNATVSPR